MAANLSTGLRAALMGPSALDIILQDGVIHCYSGPQPASADAAVAGTLLGSITRDGGPFTPGSPTNGLRFTRSGIYLLKNPAHVWRFEGIATGTLGWFRLCANAADDGLASSVAVRMDGAIGLPEDEGDVQMRFNTLAATAATSTEIAGFIFAFPPLPAA